MERGNREGGRDEKEAKCGGDRSLIFMGAICHGLLPHDQVFDGPSDVGIHGAIGAIGARITCSYDVCKHVTARLTT